MLHARRNLSNVLPKKNIKILEKARAALKPIEDEIGNLELEIGNRKSEIESQRKEHDEAAALLAASEAQAPDVEALWMNCCACKSRKTD